MGWDGRRRERHIRTVFGDTALAFAMSTMAATIGDGGFLASWLSGRRHESHLHDNQHDAENDGRQFLHQAKL